LPGSGKGAIQIMAIPDVFQSTPYTCGPSALSALLNYYGYLIREDAIAESAKTIPYKGTGPRNLTIAAKSFVKDPNSVELI
jgi:predicted double-glycine peptidase